MQRKIEVYTFFGPVCELQAAAATAANSSLRPAAASILDWQFRSIKSLSNQAQHEKWSEKEEEENGMKRKIKRNQIKSNSTILIS